MKKLKFLQDNTLQQTILVDILLTNVGQQWSETAGDLEWLCFTSQPIYNIYCLKGISMRNILNITKVPSKQVKYLHGLFISTIME